MKVAGIVVFNPDYNRLLENINAVYSQVDMLAIYLNSDVDRSYLSGFSKLQFLNNGKNNGIAKGLNEIMSFADSQSAKWCLFLDQDTVVPRNIIEEYEEFIDLPSAAVLTPCIHDNKDKEKKDYSKVAYTLMDMCITSGSYNNVKIWKQLKGFRDEYFMDYVDWEYCARVRANGFKIYRINELSVNHQLGSKEYHKIFMWNVFTYNHSAFRKYYITRNTIVTYKLFPEEIRLSHPYLRTLKRLLLTILFEDEKWKKIEAILRGLKDAGHLYKNIKENKDYGY